MKRKLILVLTAAMLCALLLPACSSTPSTTSGTADSGESAADSTAATDSDPAAITFMEVLASPSRTEWLDVKIPEFEAANAGITVEREVVPWEQAHDKLVTLVASKTLPDVLETAANWLPEFGMAGAYEDLQPYFDAWDGKEEMADIAIDLGKSYDNTLYEMPYGLYIVNMMYRKDWLAEQDIPVPTTITEYYQAIADVTDKEQNRYGYAFRGGMGNWGVLSCLLLGEMGTGEYFEEDGVTCTLRRPEAATAMQNFGDLYFNEYAPADSLNWGYAETVDSFTSGVTGFIVQDTEVIGVCLDKLTEEQFGTAMAPAGKDGKTYLIAGHGGFSISAFSEHKQQAWEFIAYMVSPDVNAEWAQNSWLVPSNKGALENPVFAEGLMAPVGEALNDPDVVLYSHPDYLPEWGEFYNKVSMDELQAFLLQEQTAAEMLSNVSDYLEAAQAAHLAGQA